MVTVSDWYHKEMPGLLSYYLDHTANQDGSEPVPYSALLNDAQDIKLNVQPGKTYFIRTINMAAFSQAYIHFDQVCNLSKESNQSAYWVLSTISPSLKSMGSIRTSRKSKLSILPLRRDTVSYSKRRAMHPRTTPCSAVWIRQDLTMSQVIFYPTLQVILYMTVASLCRHLRLSMISTLSMILISCLWTIKGSSGTRIRLLRSS